MEFRKLIASRRSGRAYADRPVEAEKVERMLEGARWSPSSANRQPWRYVIVDREAPSRAALEAALDPGNAWAKRAPVLIAAAARRADGAVVESRDYYLHDTGLATMSLLYRGVDQGLLVHPMAGWREGAVRAALGIPDDAVPIAVVAVGYPGRHEDLDEEARRKDAKPRVRKGLGEIAYSGRWGEPFRGALPASPAAVYETDIPLRFSDIDAMGHVNNAVTLTLFELGRLKFFADVMGASRVEDIRFILAEAVVRYRLPILLTDRVRLRMTVADVSRSSFRFLCELFDPADGRVFTEAETVQVTYDYATGRPVPLSARESEVLRGYMAG
ncbi:MAG: thioesterase family protein [Gemmatimonadota bacterium]